MNASSHERSETMQRKTRQRETIRSVLLRARRPLSPVEILARARRALPGLGIATVYRTVRALADGEDIVPVDIPGHPLRYEKAGLQHHHHFACTRCSRVFQMEGCADDISRLAPKGFRVKGHDIILYGHCPACAR